MEKITVNIGTEGAVVKKDNRQNLVIRYLLICTALLFIGLMLIVPLAAVFIKAFEQGVNLYLAAITEPEAMSAIRLTLFTALLVVPMNAVFGVAAAWAIAKFRFMGRNVLITLIDIPFAVSPVIAGLALILLYGSHGLLGPALSGLNIQVIFAVPGIILATAFVTIPFVARELIPLMQTQGTGEEEAAIMLGANGWQTFWRITLPSIKWGLLYGVILSSARAVGEFGAVSVVSGHIRGLTNTMPLHIEILYNEYQFTAAFAVASLMSLFAMLTLVLKSIIEYREGLHRAEADKKLMGGIDSEYQSMFCRQEIR
jgi:sulfate transport system permease protein